MLFFLQFCPRVFFFLLFFPLPFWVLPPQAFSPSFFILHFSSSVKCPVWCAVNHTLFTVWCIELRFHIASAVDRVLTSKNKNKTKNHPVPPPYQPSSTPRERNNNSRVKDGIVRKDTSEFNCGHFWGFQRVCALMTIFWRCLLKWTLKLDGVTGARSRPLRSKRQRCCSFLWSFQVSLRISSLKLDSVQVLRGRDLHK